ncbi:autotransporter assembly complex family protein [Shewanella sp. NIFS-20-20]|uniref:autotransporter assembly complex protein TamA n=1 Tax=Shewanella sp. NIFS-20-20 TaxID=2853806 RepID=UPI001C45891A|nr:autotransporter assembly complex family protein [Shewanella sp. NIFS-20-20]MBV7315090.1 autotransporter assembly complex protein TamA [Shewanella sp. NIFS-20-20]
MRSLALILFLLLCCLSAISSAEDTEQNPWLVIEIQGVDKPLQQNITAHIGALPTSAVQRRAFLFNLEDNIHAALESMGFYHGQIKQTLQQPSDGPWRLTLDVSPGAPTVILWVDIRVQGEMLDDSAFNQWLNQISIRPGQRLNQGSYEALKSQLLGLSLSRGYFDAKYQLSQITVNRDLNIATISLFLDSGDRFHIGNVTFSGSDLRPKLLEQMVPFDENAPYSTARMGAINRDLLDSNYFSGIQVVPEIENTKDGIIPVRVELTPKPNNTLNLGFGVDIGNSANNKFAPRVSATWNTPQINRLGHSQTTTLEWSPDRPKFLTTYSIPLSHPVDDKLQIKFGLTRDKYGVTQVFDSAKADFVNTGQLESTKRQFGVIRQQKLANNWLVGYSVEAIKEFYNQASVDYDPTFVLFGIGAQQTVRSDNTLDPKNGYSQTYSIQYADPSLGSAIRLIRLQADGIWVHTFFSKHRFVSRLNLGIDLAKDDELALVPPSLRYFAGGDQSIRGYGYQELGPFLEYTDSEGRLNREVFGGRYLIVGSLEYQYYFTPTWRVAAFVDAGNAFDKDQFTPIVAVGPGIHWISPVGPIKLDIGFGLKASETQDRPWRIHLTMGTVL